MKHFTGINIIYSLVTFAVLDDIFKRNIGANTSLLVSRIGSLPGFLSDYDIKDEQTWNGLFNLIMSIMIMINNGKISKEGFKLTAMGGGARTTRRKRNRVKNRTTKRR